MVDSLASGGSSDRPRKSVLAITDDATACRALAAALRSEGMFALAATPSKACRLVTVFLFDAVVLLGNVPDDQREQIRSTLLVVAQAATPCIEQLDVIDPRLVVHAARRVLRLRR